ncbi:alkyl sulfatase dimerization domain-containing protein [Pseudohalioglobus sediminis]|nr:alkyl sulfatase dimerization domain-containing protein [Pseudohalioglobus sediminis]
MLKPTVLIRSALFSLLAITATSGVAAEDVNLNTDDVRAGGTPTGNLIRIPVERIQVTDNIFYASGLANAYVVNTSEGAVVIDTGFAHQSPRQMALLKEVIDGPVKYIFLPQGQHDDIGGIDLIKEDGTQIIMTRNSMEYMIHRKKAQGYLSPRYAALYNWAPELDQKGSERKKKATPFPYEVIAPDILVEDEAGYKFELGGVRFEVMSLPGAEGINSAGLWLPEEKILFAGGGSVGPDFPMWPNLGTVRADRNRILTEYIDTINKIIALEPEMLLPQQNQIHTNKDEIMTSLVLMRDAAQYVHDQIWAGLSEGKDVYELMREIQLPEHLAHLSQQHGRVEWTVRETVYQAGGWFQYRYTSELYPFRPHEIYPELVRMAGEESVVKEARVMLAAGELERAMMMAEAALAADQESQAALILQLDVLQALLKRAQEGYNTFSEVAWLQSQIAKVRTKLGRA